MHAPVVLNPPASMRTSELGPLLRDAAAGDVAMNQCFAQAMLVGAAAGFASGKQAGDGGAFHVDDLTFAVDPQASIRDVPNRTDRGGIERRLVDLVHGRVFSAPEIRIGALIHVGVPLADRLLEILQRHPLELMARLDLASQLIDRIGAEEIAVIRSEGMADVPAVALDRAPVEDRPQRAGVIVWRLRALIHGKRSVHRRIAVVHLLDPAWMAVAPVTLDMFHGMLGHAIARAARPYGAVVALRKIH